MAIAMMAITVSTGEFPTWLRRVTQISLMCFAYLWLSVVFIFTSVLREQDDWLRFQAQALWSDLASTYRPGDMVVYDPQIFSNPRYLSQVERRFPIFRHSSYHNSLTTPFGFTRFRFPELVGLDYHIFRPMEIMTTGFCGRQYANESADQNPRTGASSLRWQIYRTDTQTICVAFPANFLNISPLANGDTEINFDFATFPITASRESEPATTDNTQLAIWPVDNPEAIQWLHPTEIRGQTAHFNIPNLNNANENGNGDLIAVHFFLNDTFLFSDVFSLNQVKGQNG
jgi:hypothetical protein